MRKSNHLVMNSSSTKITEETLVDTYGKDYEEIWLIEGGAVK